jgi:hypothetical protein
VGEEAVQEEESVWRRAMTSGAGRSGGEDGLTSGAWMSVRAGDWAAYPFGKYLGRAVGRFCGWTEKLPAAFSAFLNSFSFFFFCFLVYFPTFAKMFQINSNHFLKFSTML